MNFSDQGVILYDLLKAECTGISLAAQPLLKQNFKSDMKKLSTFYGFIFLLLVCADARSQVIDYNWQENYYYSFQGERDETCGEAFSVFQGYWYNTPVYYYYQTCTFRNWQSVSGSYLGYFWEADMNGNYSWVGRTEERTWWYFTWQTYTQRVA